MKFCPLSDYLIIYDYFVLPLFRAGLLRGCREVYLWKLHHGPQNNIGLLRVHGKGNKQRALFVVDKLYINLVRYLNHPESPKKKFDPLFPVQKNKAISSDRVQRMIKEYTHNAGISERITPHVLRHSFAAEMYHQGVPLYAIQDMLGHVNEAETSIYIHVSNELEQQALENITIEGRMSWQ